MFSYDCDDTLLSESEMLLDDVKFPLGSYVEIKYDAFGKLVVVVTTKLDQEIRF